MKQSSTHLFTKILATPFVNLFQFIFPPLCILCETDFTDNNYWLCDDCLKKLEENILNRQACKLCGESVKKKKCICSNTWQYSFDRVLSLYDLDKTLKKCVHQFKYKHKKQFARFLGSTLTQLTKDSFDIYAPVPLHPFKKIKRGYNQADELAYGFVKSMNVSHNYYPNLLKRLRNTTSQTKLSKSERADNLSGVFALRDCYHEQIKGKKILLFDDVVTTGATGNECAQALKKHGATSVTLLSFARA